MREPSWCNQIGCGLGFAVYNTRRKIMDWSLSVADQRINGWTGWVDIEDAKMISGLKLKS